MLSLVRISPRTDGKGSKKTRINEEKKEIIWKISEKYLSLQCERRNQVEPRCAERWHLRDDEQFDLAAWFLLPKGKECGVAISSLWIQSWPRVASFYCIFIYRLPLNSFLSVLRVAVMKLTSFTSSRFTFIL